MKAIVYRRYGPPEVLLVEDQEAPRFADDGILVRVEASSVNAVDWHLMRGKPYIARLTSGLRRPKSSAVGVDVAGYVEAVGRNVTHVRPGDAVFGARSGAFAELVSGRTFSVKPAGLTFEEAAAVPVAGTTALQAVRDHGHVKPGERVLVTGAGGGVGTFAVQIATASGAAVTAVTGPTKMATVSSLGADRVVSHEQFRSELVRSRERFDVVIDVAGDRSLRELGRVLVPRGTVVMVGPGRGDWLGPVARILAARVRSRLSAKRFGSFLATVTRDDLLVLKELIEAGKVRPVIDRVYPLAEAAEAIRYVETGGACGKVVIKIGNGG
jgi:NADPH:quinone reductase-like Zn-dependent oxidoreductase